MKAAALLLALALAGCAQTMVKEYVGAKVVTGSGGARQVVDGVDLWTDGTPPRPFIVLAILDDTRRTGLISTMTREADLAAATRKAGGDALIIYQEGTAIAGFVAQSFGTAQISGNQGTGAGTTASVAIRERLTKGAVIRYQ